MLMKYSLGYVIMSKNPKLRVKTPKSYNSNTDWFTMDKSMGSFINSFFIT